MYVLFNVTKWIIPKRINMFFDNFYLFSNEFVWIELSSLWCNNITSLIICLFCDMKKVKFVYKSQQCNNHPTSYLMYGKLQTQPEYEKTSIYKVLDQSFFVLPTLRMTLENLWIWEIRLDNSWEISSPQYDDFLQSCSSYNSFYCTAYSTISPW